jgi:hypothetical protein
MSAVRVPLVIEAEGCRCCADLPGYLGCNGHGTARCEACGWSWRGDLDDLWLVAEGDVCPDCTGGEEDEA